MPLTDEERAKKKAEAEQLAHNLDETSKLATAKFESAVIKYISSGERVKGLHVTQVAKDCPRHSAWEYADGVSVDDESSETLDERSAIVFLVGRKVHEPAATDIHELELEFDYNGLVLHGTLDEAVFTDERVSIFDKKTTRYLPDSERSHHRSQVGDYAVMVNSARLYGYCKKCKRAKLTNKAKIEFETSKDGHDHDIVEEKVDFTDKEYFGAVTYINVGESKSMWAPYVKSFAFKISVADSRHVLEGRLAQIKDFETGGIPPESVYGWECAICPYWAPCRMLDAGEANWKAYMPKQSR